jgi:superoxide reductase
MANKIYRCDSCKNLVEVLHDGKGELFCCGNPMSLVEENRADGGSEKHIPVIENNRVKVGSTEHPMEEGHYIEWIEGAVEKEISRVFLKPGKKPLAEFSFEPSYARAYCNLHGLWKTSD